MPNIGSQVSHSALCSHFTIVGRGGVVVSRSQFDFGSGSLGTIPRMHARFHKLQIISFRKLKLLRNAYRLQLSSLPAVVNQIIVILRDGEFNSGVPVVVLRWLTWRSRESSSIHRQQLFDPQFKFEMKNIINLFITQVAYHTVLQFIFPVYHIYIGDLPPCHYGRYIQIHVRFIPERQLGSLRVYCKPMVAVAQISILFRGRGLL